MIGFRFDLFDNRPFLPRVALPRLEGPSSDGGPSPGSAPEKGFAQSSASTILDFHLNKFFRQKFKSTDPAEYNAFRRMNARPAHQPEFYLSAHSAPQTGYSGAYLSNPNIYSMILTDRELQKEKLRGEI